MSVESAGEVPPLEEVVDRMTEDRGALLGALVEAEDSLPTGALRDRAGVPSGSMHYHLDALREWGLVEEVGEVEAQGAIPAKVWAATDRGREYMDRADARGVASAERVAELEREVEELQQRFNQMADVVERLAGDGGAGGS